MGLVLCYHSVCDAWDHQLAVRQSTFERQVRALLRRGYKPVAADEVIASSGRVFHVTFDDAYRDIAPALDLLEELGVPATVFAATQFADGGLPLAVPELEGEVRARPERLATMDWSRLRDIAARGFEVGSHTVSHPHLPRLSDPELEAELLDSRLRCEEELGTRCRYLAYPFGEHDDRVRAAARRAGYSAGFALHERGDVRDPFAVPRIDFYRDDSRLEAWVKTSMLRRPAYALARRRRAPWPAPAPYGHGWMAAVLPAGATRFRVDDPAIAGRLLASGAALVEGAADVEIGSPSTLTGSAPMAVSVLAAPPHDADSRAIRVVRRLWNWIRIGTLSRRAKKAVRELGYRDVEVIRWDVAQTFGRPGAKVPRRRLVERFPQRALVIARRGRRDATVLDAVLRDARLAGATGLDRAPASLRTGGVLIITTDHSVLRAALSPAAVQIERQVQALEGLREARPDALVADRTAWPLAGGRTGLATWSTERRLPGAHPESIRGELLYECVDFLAALHETRPTSADSISLVDYASVVAPYRPEPVAEKLVDLAERLDRAVAHLPRGFAHGDFFAGNVLADNGHLTGVIDWDGATPGALPFLDLIHLRHTQDHPVPDDEWGPALIQFLLPWAHRPYDAATRRYCDRLGIELDHRTLEAVVLAYWLSRVAYQLATHRFRQSQQTWLLNSVDAVLDAVWTAEPAFAAGRQLAGSAR